MTARDVTGFYVFFLYPETNPIPRGPCKTSRCLEATKIVSPVPRDNFLCRPTQTNCQQTRVYPYPLGAGSARPNPKMGAPDPGNPLFLGFSVLGGGLRPWSQTMVSEGARPWGRGRSGDFQTVHVARVRRESRCPISLTQGDATFCLTL